MSFDPKNFFIGLIEFFSVLLPGAILVFVFGEAGWAWVFGDERALPSGAEGGLVFLFTSYLVGHFVFLVSSWLDEVYDRARRHTLDTQIRTMAWEGRVLAKWQRSLLKLIFKRERNVAVEAVGRLKRQALQRLGASGAVNNFQWCKARLTLGHAEALAAVQRFEADAKFFRSLTVVLTLLAVWYVTKGQVEVALSLVAVLLLAFWRYMEQRHKATNQAYWFVLTQAGDDPEVSLPSEPARPDGLTHAGGVVFRERTGVREYLLVQAKRAPNEWVLPKGHIEAGEHPRETAVREVLEEAGVWAEVKGALVPQTFEAFGEEVRVQYFLMKVRAHGEREDRWRGRKWLPHADAIQSATHELTKAVLIEAETLASAPCNKA